MSILEAGRVSQISQGSVAANNKASGGKASLPSRSFEGRAAQRALTRGSERANKDLESNLQDLQRYIRDPRQMLNDFKDRNGNPSYKAFSQRFMAFTGEGKKAWTEASRLWDLANDQHAAGSKEFEDAAVKALKSYFADFGSVSRFERDKKKNTLIRTDDLKLEVKDEGVRRLREAAGKSPTGSLNLNGMLAFLNSETQNSLLVMDHSDIGDRRIPGWLAGRTQAGRAGTGFGESKLRYLSRKGSDMFKSAEEGSGRYQEGMGTVKLGTIKERAMAYLENKAKNDTTLKNEFMQSGGGDETSGIYNYVYDLLDIVRKDSNYREDLRFGKDFKLENGTDFDELKAAADSSRAYTDLAAAQPKGEDWTEPVESAFGGYINPDTGLLGKALTGQSIDATIGKLDPEHQEEGRRYAKWLQTWKQHPSARVTTADLNSLDKASLALQDQRSVTLFENTGFSSVEEINESIKADREAYDVVEAEYTEGKKRALSKEVAELTSETKDLEKLIKGRDKGVKVLLHPPTYAVETEALERQLDAKIARTSEVRRAIHFSAFRKDFQDVMKRQIDPKLAADVVERQKPLRDSIIDKKSLIYQFTNGKGDYSNKDLIAVYAETLEVAQHALMHGHSFQSGESKRALEKIIDNLKKSLRTNDTDPSAINPAFQIKMLMSQEGFSWESPASLETEKNYRGLHH